MTEPVASFAPALTGKLWRRLVSLAQQQDAGVDESPHDRAHRADVMAYLILLAHHREFLGGDDDVAADAPDAQSQAVPSPSGSRPGR